MTHKSIIKHKYYLLFGIIVVFVVIGMILTSPVNAAVWNDQEYETKNPPPNEIINTARELVIKKGISETYFDKHFSLKIANVDYWSAEKGWESASVDWGFKINDEYEVVYTTKAHKIDEGFLVTENYIIKDGIAYSFETTKLHEFGKLISRLEAQEKLKECLGFKPDVEMASLSLDGNLYLSASKPLEGPFILLVTVNLETGEISCSEQSMQSELGGSKGHREPSTKEPKQEISNLIYYFTVFTIIIILIIVLFLKFRKK